RLRGGDRREQHTRKRGCRYRASMRHDKPHDQSPRVTRAAPKLLLRRLEVSQVRRRLILLDRHQVAVAAHHVIVLADPDVMIVLGAMVEIPDHIAAFALILLGNGPGPRERIVDGGDLVEQDVLVRLVDGDALLDDGLAIVVQLDAARLERARTLEPAGLDFQNVIAAVAVLIDPLADRVAAEGGLELLWPGAPVS